VPHLTVNGHRLFYVVDGDGPPVLLLHAGLGSLAEWRETLLGLAADHRVIAADRWGYGHSDPRPAFEDGFFAADADEQVALLDALGVEAAHVVGHSDGGTIALWLARRHPTRVRSLLVEAAHVFSEAETLNALRAYGPPDRWPGSLRRYLERLHGVKAEALGAAWLAHWTSDDMAVWDMRGELPPIPQPTLIVQGSADPLSTPQQVAALEAGLPHATTWWVEGAGHTPHLERPDDFNARLRAWLRERDADVRGQNCRGAVAAPNGHQEEYQRCPHRFRAWTPTSKARPSGPTSTII